MSSVHIIRYNRCKWMAIVSAVFAAMTIGFLIPGAVGIAGENHYNDTLLYLALVDLIFAVIFLIGWWSCQMEVDDAPALKFNAPVRMKRSLSDASIVTATSINSETTRQLLTLGGASALTHEAKA